MTRRKLKRQLKRLTSERQKTLEKLAETKSDLREAKKAYKQSEYDQKKLEESLHKADRKVSDLKEQLDIRDRALQKANRLTDEYALKMDQTHDQLDRMSNIEQEKMKADQQIQEQQKLIDALENEVETLNLKVGIEHVESAKLSQKIKEIEEKHTNASDKEKK